MPNDQDDPEGWSGDYIEVRPEVAKMIEELGDDPEDIQRAVDRMIEEHSEWFRYWQSPLTSILNYFPPSKNGKRLLSNEYLLKDLEP